MATMTHGTIYAYRKGCRCEPCRKANYRAAKRWRIKAGSMPVPDGAHGTLNGYKVYGCRCDPCKKAKRDEWHRWNTRRTRMRALAAAGLPRDWEGDLP